MLLSIEYNKKIQTVHKKKQDVYTKKCKLSLTSSSSLSPATPSTTKSSLVRVPVLSKQRISTLPANGILKLSILFLYLYNQKYITNHKKMQKNITFVLRMTF